jgi:hypothetical protein
LKQLEYYLFSYVLSCKEYEVGIKSIICLIRLVQIYRIEAEQIKIRRTCIFQRSLQDPYPISCHGARGILKPFAFPIASWNLARMADRRKPRNFSTMSSYSPIELFSLEQS